MRNVAFLGCNLSTNPKFTNDSQKYQRNAGNLYIKFGFGRPAGERKLRSALRPRFPYRRAIHAKSPTIPLRRQSRLRR